MNQIKYIFCNHFTHLPNDLYFYIDSTVYYFGDDGCFGISRSYLELKNLIQSDTMIKIYESN